ncbi:RidA family protein [Hyphomonas sp.]|uniref:RidA family protein n=1 Tax=Hyphomonas sp. TaxID=87 RepID=UPI003242B8A6
MTGKQQRVVPEGTQAIYDHYHFAPAIRVGDMIWISGQVGIDENFVAGEDMEQQARFAFEAIRKTLAVAGAGLKDVVELMTFHTDLRGEMEDFTKIKDAFFPKDFPCWTALGVSQLAAPEYKVEIRVVAVVGSGA